MIQLKRIHIKEGKSQSPGSCPVALALYDAGFSDLLVFDDYIQIENVKYRAPRSVTRFISRFDRAVSRSRLRSFNFRIGKRIVD